MHLKWEKMCVDQSDNWWEVQLKVAHNLKENPYQHNANQTVLIFFKKNASPEMRFFAFPKKKIKLFMCEDHTPMISS